MVLDPRDDVYFLCLGAGRSCTSYRHISTTLLARYVALPLHRPAVDSEAFTARAGLRQCTQHLPALHDDGEVDAASRFDLHPFRTHMSAPHVCPHVQKGRGYATTAAFYFGGVW